uniref:GNAT family N-acetyltransferase n=1 Tax=Klebsiella pneumoniae TaxID=573 RepID=UPI0025A19678
VDGEKAVGFVFYGYDRDGDHYLLCRYMIDDRHQNKGYGKAFLPLVVELIRNQYGCRDVYTSVHEDNARALH